jgi:hypothetical protein
MGDQTQPEQRQRPMGKTRTMRRPDHERERERHALFGDCRSRGRPPGGPTAGAEGEPPPTTNSFGSDRRCQAQLQTSRHRAGELHLPYPEQRQHDAAGGAQNRAGTLEVPYIYCSKERGTRGESCGSSFNLRFTCSESSSSLATSTTIWQSAHEKRFF